MASADDVAAAKRPAVRVNQLGYLPGSPKRATLVSAATAPLDFVVTAGDVVWRGLSEPWPHRPEPTSGLAVHVLDFSAAPVVGVGVRIVVGDERSHAFRVAPAECRWQLDWMVRMLVPPGRPLAGMAFHRVHGARWSPMPGWPHEDPTERVLHRPSTAATLHVAAVAAQGARLFAALDPPYAQRLLAAARTAHAAAHAQPTLIAPDDQGRFGGGPYGDDRLDDDFYWAAAQLWLATGEQEFLDEVTASPEHTADVFDPAGFDFDAVAGPARLEADAAVRPRPRPGLPTSAARGAGGRRELARAPRVPERPPAGRAPSAALLPRRAHVRDDERRVHPVERASGLRRPVPHRVNQMVAIAPLPYGPERGLRTEEKDPR